MTGMFAKMQKPRNTLNMASYALVVDEAKESLTLADTFAAKPEIFDGIPEIILNNLCSVSQLRLGPKWVQGRI